jgi:phosphohistidine phosphatase SixA
MKLAIALRVIPITLFLLFSTSSTKAAESAQLFKALASGNHFALMRHALAPGNGDPTNFEVNDCSTQRNLNDIGRVQAKSIGQKLINNGIDQASVFTSQWCRCRETAELLGFDTVVDNPILNSFYQRQENRKQQTEQLQQWLLEVPLGKPVILVTHQVNITAFSNVYPSSGDMVIVRRNDDKTFTVLGAVSTEL